MEKGVLSVILEGDLCLWFRNWVINSRILQQRDVEKTKGEETGICTGWKLEPLGLTFYTHKTNLFYSHTSQIVQVWEFNLHPFLCFFELPTDVTFLHTQKIVHVSFPPPPLLFLKFWTLKSSDLIWTKLTVRYIMENRFL